ncbi:MAG: type II secretion system protein GspK, partial [Terricaulis sp.]
MNVQRGASGGYALLLVLMVLTIMSVVLLSTVGAQAQLAPALQRQLREAREARFVQSLAAQTAFLLMTEPVGPRSINVGGDRAGVANAVMRRGRRSAARELRLDGRFYDAWREGGLLVLAALQDENGLLSLNAGDDRSLSALLGEAGVAAQSAERLSASLGDFIDADELTRLHGAEGDVYRRSGLAPPLNRLLPNRWSARGALGWGGGLDLMQRERIWRWTNAARDSAGVNVNTAPVEVLAAVLGDRRRAAALVRQREQSGIQGVSETIEGANAGPGGVVLAGQPGTSFRLIVGFVERGRERREYEGQLVLAGAEAERPFYWREARQRPALQQ